MTDPTITTTMEDYLEAIYCIGRNKRAVRVKNIADRIGVSMPTVTAMLQSLGRRGLVAYHRHEYPELTPEGEKIGKEIHRRHQAIMGFLADVLGIDPEESDREACRLEHGISAGTLDRLIQFIHCLETCPGMEPGWIEAFKHCRSKTGSPGPCRTRPETRATVWGRPGETGVHTDRK